MQLLFGKGVRLVGCHIKVDEARFHTHTHTHTHKAREAYLKIGDDCYLKNAVFGFYGPNSRIVLRDGTEVNAHEKGRETYFLCGEDTEISVGENCLFSNSIILCTTDFHRIYDESGMMINGNRNICLEKHVWVGQRTYICKGVELGENTVVGACSVVTKSFMQGDCIIVGNPAIVKKESIRWEQ